MGSMTTPYVPSKGQMTDALTKVLSIDKFREVIDKLGMEDIHSPA